MNEIKLGAIIKDSQFRDAVHIAIARKFLKTHDREYKRCIAGCGFMHEGMNKDHQCSREHGHKTDHSFLCEKPST